MYKIKQTPEDFIVEEEAELELKEKSEYSYFILKKKNLNTEEAIQKIGESFKLNRKRISFCGNKDKIAITIQHISIHHLSKQYLKDYEFENISLKYLGQGDKRLNLGSHKRNKFTIIIKEANEPKEDTEILNLFGHQRFSNNNDLVGEAIIKKDFKKAVELVLENNGKQEDDVRDFINNHPTNYVGAIRTIPKKILQLLINSYQSKLFNEMAKKSNENEIPIIGFGTEETEKVKKILDKEKISTRDFIIKELPNLSREGEFRNRLMDVKDLKIEKIEKKTYKLSFSLGKGSYATVLIEQLFS